MIKDETRVQIKSCPKCGDAWLYASTGDYYSGYESRGFRIKCMCGFAWKTIPFCPTAKEAVSKWNESIEENADVERKEKTDETN